jgi:hypothetical protein
LKIEKKINLTLSRFVAEIGQPQAFKCQFLLTAKGANSPKLKLFDTVACLVRNQVVSSLV